MRIEVKSSAALEDENDQAWKRETILPRWGLLTAPTAMVCVAIADDDDVLVLVVVLDVVYVSAKAKLSKAVENTTTMLSNIVMFFSIS